MNIYDSKTYLNDLNVAIESVPNLGHLSGKKILITGAAGLIGSFVVDMLMYANFWYDLHIEVYALGRSKTNLENRFSGMLRSELHLVQQDIVKDIEFREDVDYIIHAASNAYPAAFNLDPVGTMLGNIIGTHKLIQYGIQCKCERFLFVSSGEVYGQANEGIKKFDENYSGYVNPIDTRSCYPNSKRAAETLCVSYAKQYGLNTVVVRPCHVYGPNVTVKDNRATAQFFNNVINGEDIVLKSTGAQVRSYCYIADCASALLTVLINGQTGCAYNIANRDSVISIAGFAKVVAEKSGKKCVFNEPNEMAVAEQSPIKNQVLCSEKLEGLGWNGRYDITRGIECTLEVYKEIV